MRTPSVRALSFSSVQQSSEPRLHGNMSDGLDHVRIFSPASELLEHVAAKLIQRRWRIHRWRARTHVAAWFYPVNVAFKDGGVQGADDAAERGIMGAEVEGPPPKQRRSRIDPTKKQPSFRALPSSVLWPNPHIAVWMMYCGGVLEGSASILGAYASGYSFHTVRFERFHTAASVAQSIT